MYGDGQIFRKLGEMIYTSNRTRPIYFGFVPCRNQSGYLDPFPYPDWYRSLWFVLKTRCWNRWDAGLCTVPLSDAV